MKSLRVTMAICLLFAALVGEAALANSDEQELVTTDRIQYTKVGHESRWLKLDISGNQAYASTNDFAYAGGQPMEILLNTWIPWPLPANQTVTVPAKWHVGHYGSADCYFNIVADISAEYNDKLTVEWVIPAYVGSSDCQQYGTRRITTHWTK